MSDFDRARIGLPELAAACGLSRGYFVGAFKATYGETPHQWRSRSRVEKAKALLRDTSLTLLEIATLCGFADQSHFTRLFGQYTGLPPARWRRRDHG